MADTAPVAQPITFRGSRLAIAAMRAAGWRVVFEGVPTQQGVVIVYPHTSNWDFVAGMVAKWAMGIPLRFWAKHSLFRLPVFGPWLRRRGGVPVDRAHPQGLVGQMTQQLREHAQAGQFFWLAVTPEGTRSAVHGWKSGFYRVAVHADVPLGLASLDFGRREVRFADFMRLTGDEAVDMARIAAHYQGVRGCKPQLAGRVRLLEGAARQALTGETP